MEIDKEKLEFDKIIGNIPNKSALGARSSAVWDAGMETKRQKKVEIAYCKQIRNVLYYMRKERCSLQSALT